jgi:probable O-glycosylation ligase (exosortase A-associated)
VVSLAIALFVFAFLGAGMRRPFIWVLAYLYVDIVAPQKLAVSLLDPLQISLVAFIAAFGGWAFADYKQDSRWTLRQSLMLILLIYCGLTTTSADFPIEAAAKWAWVWKALVFALFLPLTLRTKLRIEAVALTMVLSAATIIIIGGIKTAAGGGGYGTLRLLLSDNTGLNEGSIMSCVAIAIIPLIVWLMKHGTIFPSDWRVKLFGFALIASCLLIPIGTQARTGLLCIGVLAVISLRSVKRRFLYIAGAGLLAAVTIPFLPASYTKRMDTIGNHAADQSASTRVAVWMWTLEYVKDHPFGGGFDAFRANRLTVETRSVESSGNTEVAEVKEIRDKARAYHSSYFEMLGEQGYFGLALWLWLMLSGLWQMERLRRRWQGRTGEGEQWQAPLANALQQALVIYLVGSLFVGIAFQPFVFMLIGLQCGLWSYLRRVDSPVQPKFQRKPGVTAKRAVGASRGALHQG